MSADLQKKWKGLAARMREQAHGLDPDKEWVGGAPAQLREAADALDNAASVADALATIARGYPEHITPEAWGEWCTTWARDELNAASLNKAGRGKE